MTKDAHYTILKRNALITRFNEKRSFVLEVVCGLT
jgi:hypothetical protein